MRCFSPAAVFVVIHCRKVVMHKGIRMNHFNGCQKRLNHRAAAPEHPVRFEHQHRAQALPARTDTVIHGFHHAFLKSFFFRKIPGQYLFNIGCTFPDFCFEVFFCKVFFCKVFFFDSFFCSVCRFVFHIPWFLSISCDGILDRKNRCLSHFFFYTPLAAPG